MECSNPVINLDTISSSYADTISSSYVDTISSSYADTTPLSYAGTILSSYAHLNRDQLYYSGDYNCFQQISCGNNEPFPLEINHN